MIKPNRISYRILCAALIVLSFPIISLHAETSATNASSVSVGAYALADLPFGTIADWIDGSVGGGLSCEWAPAKDSPWAIVARVQGGVHIESDDDIESFRFVSAFAGGRWLIPIGTRFSFAPEAAYGIWVNILNGTPYADQAIQLSPLVRFTPSRVGFEFGPSATMIMSGGGAILHAGIRAGARIGL